MNVHSIEQFDFLFVCFFSYHRVFVLFSFPYKPALAFPLLIYLITLAQEHAGAF